MAIRFSNSRRLGRARRATAALLVGFLILAASRGLVPGLCATLAEVQGADPSDCAAEHSCCVSSPSEETGQENLAQYSPHVECAFCHLATARILTATAPVVTPHVHFEDEAPLPAEDTAPTPPAWSAAGPRAPPALLQ